MPGFRSRLNHVAVTLLRLLPVPARLKHTLVWLASPRALVAGLALIPDAEGRLLVLHSRWVDAWQFPGGGIRAGEQPDAGTCREVMEETGQVVTIRALAGIRSIGQPYRVLLLYACDPLPGPPQLSHEHDAWRYVTPGDLPPGLADHLTAG